MPSKTNPKKFNPIGKYLWKTMQKRRPGDTLYALNKRANVKNFQTYRTFTAPGGFNQAILLMRYCSDLGISMEEAILTEPLKSSSLSRLQGEAKYWKEKYLQAQKKYRALTKKIKSKATAKTG